MPEIYLYAEVLTHIRQLTLHASLTTEKNEHTKIFVSSDKKIITVVHDGQTSSIYLPTQISGTANITFPLDRRTELSARIEIEDLEQLKAGAEDDSKPDVPWSAAELTNETALQCKHCDGGVLAAGNVSGWKDLPSENWAELMDLWFCHKPHETNEANSTAADSRGFGAKSKFIAKQGTGLVDIVSFLVHQKDCSRLKVSTEDVKDGIASLQCFQCNTVIGSANESDESYRLYKSRLSLQKTSSTHKESYPSAIFICAQLLSLIDSSITRKIVVHSNSGVVPPTTSSFANGDSINEIESQPLLLWIFNPDIYYSSSRTELPTAHRAMKVFYKALPKSSVTQALETNPSFEELILPTQDLIDLTQTLQKSTTILPQSAGKFQEWDVGLLDHHEAKPSGEDVLARNPLSRKAPRDMEMFGLPAGMHELYV